MEKRKARAFGAIPMTWTVGAAVGYVLVPPYSRLIIFNVLSLLIGRRNRPLIGGYFSRPAKHWPLVFDNLFWVEHPYFLPCVVVGAITFVIFLGSLVGLREVRLSFPVSLMTLPSRLVSTDARDRTQSATGRSPRRSSSQRRQQHRNDVLLPSLLRLRLRLHRRTHSPHRPHLLALHLQLHPRSRLYSRPQNQDTLEGFVVR